jgi:glucose/arabinose dehydrogenase
MPVVSKYSRVSPAGITRYRNTALEEAFKDNLFSAQFNTHRIIRHTLFRDGASFRTEDQVFFSSKDEDFHPTDVMEDGDGSLLVVETGGWFIKGCRSLRCPSRNYRALFTVCAVQEPLK